MKIISAVLVDNVLKPSEPIPTNAIHVVCNGTNYTVYEQGDELPHEPSYDEQL